VSRILLGIKQPEQTVLISKGAGRWQHLRVYRTARALLEQTEIVRITGFTDIVHRPDIQMARRNNVSDA
jgi:hypothetical protein